MEFTREFLQTKVKYIDNELVTISEMSKEGKTPIERDLTMRDAIRKGLTSKREGDQSTAEERMSYAILADKIWNSDSYSPSSEDITSIKQRCKEYWLPEIALFIVKAVDPASIENGKVKKIEQPTATGNKRRLNR